MDRLTDRVVAAEAEGHVGDAAGHQRAGEVLLDPPGGLDEVDPVGRVLLDAGRHREDVGVDDDVFGRVADLVDKDPVCRGADLASARQVVGLALLVEGHDDDGGAVFAAEPGVLDERLDAFLHGDRVDDRLALDGLEAGLDDLPLGRVDHDRDPADVRLAGHQLEEAVHGRDPVDHSFVHVDVDDLSAGLDLLPGDGEGGAVVAGLDEFAEARRTGDVGPLADVDEQRLLVDRQRLQPGQPGGRRDLGNRAGRHTGDGGDQLRDVLGGRAAAAADDVDQARRRELADDAGHGLRALVVFTEGVGQAGVGVTRDEGVGNPGELSDIGTHLVGAEGAVEADRQRPGVADGVPEGLGDLTGERAAGSVGDRAGDDDWPSARALLEEGLQGEDRGLGVERVEDRLDEQHVGAAVDQPAGLLEVGQDQLVEADVAGARIVDIGGDRRGLVGGAERSGDIARLAGGAGGRRVGLGAGQRRRSDVELVGEVGHAVVGQRDPVGVERVGLDEVAACIEVGPVDVGDDLRLGDRQQVVVALEVLTPVGEPGPAIVGLGELVALDEGAHRAVQDEDPGAQRLRERDSRVGTGAAGHLRRSHGR